VDRWANRWTGGERDPVLNDLVIQGPEDLGHALLGILLTVPPPLTNLVKLREILAKPLEESKGLDWLVCRLHLLEEAGSLHNEILLEVVLVRGSGGNRLDGLDKVGCVVDDLGTTRDVVRQIFVYVSMTKRGQGDGGLRGG